MRILFCLDYYYPHVGGAEVLFTGLAEGLVRAGWTVDVVTQALPGVPRRETVNGVRITRVRSGGSRFVFPLTVLPALLRLAKQADIIHTTTFAAALPAWLAAKIRRRPLVLTVHEVWIGKWNTVSEASKLMNALYSIAERLIYCVSYRQYVAVSQATARDLTALGVPSTAVEVIHNGVDTAFWDASRHQAAPRNGGAGGHLFFFSGRPGISKGLPYLLQALAEVVRTQPAARLLAVVSNSRANAAGYAAAQRQIQELELAAHVELRPSVPYGQLPSLVLSADTVVVPSLSEGFGFAAAEACALGRPVIVTDNASLPEVASGCVLTVPPRDVAALAAAMLRAMAGDYAEVPRKTFTVQATLDRHLALYARLCPAGGQP